MLKFYENILICLLVISTSTLNSYAKQIEQKRKLIILFQAEMPKRFITWSSLSNVSAMGNEVQLIVKLSLFWYLGFH